MYPKNGTEEYYKLHRDKVNDYDIETWKYLPFDNGRRKIYDYKYLPLDKYLERYYSDYKDSEKYIHWQRWMKGTIMPLYNNDFNGWKRISDQDKKHIEMHIRFKNWGEEMREFYNSIKEYKQFDDEILLFMSYLFVFDSFSSISFEEWINTKSFDVGFRKQDDDLYSLLEMSKYKYGMNLIKDKLMQLDWHKK